MKRTCCFAIAALVLGVLVAVPSAQAQTKKVSYAIADLGPWVSSNTSGAIKVNNGGQIIGYAYDNAATRHACVWERVGAQWIIRDLGASEYYDSSWGSNINEQGEVVGYGSIVGEAGTTNEVFHYQSSLVALPIPSEQVSSMAYGINTSGDITGRSKSNGATMSQACLWERNLDGTWTFRNLSEEDWYSSNAMELNDAGQILGWVHTDPNTRFYCLWEHIDGEWPMTAVLDGTPGILLHDINNSGQIVGYKSTDGDWCHACLLERDNGQWTTTDLHTSASFYHSEAWGINNSRQVVGYGLLVTGGRVGVLCRDGAMENLNDYLPAGSGWSLTYARDINDQGQIVGSGYNPGGYDHAFLMDTRAVTYSYTSTGSAVAIKDKSTASKSMTLTDNVTITDLNVQVKLTHSRYADLKFGLVGPNNVTRLLCNAGAVTGSGTKTLVFDDDGSAGSIVPAVPLSYYDGTSTLGKWTLKISDTVNNSKTGSFTSFTLDVVPAL